jgi:hypothetical protein
MLAENSAAFTSPPGTSPAQSENEEKKPVSAEAPEQRDLFARAQRRKLPDERKSITHKFSVGVTRATSLSECTRREHQARSS